MNGRRGTSGVKVGPGCPDGSRSVGRPDLYTEAGFFPPRGGYVRHMPIVSDLRVALFEERFANPEEEGVGHFRMRLLSTGV